MGKVVDTVADLLSVQNFNNVAEKEKLKLFRKTDGQSVCEVILSNQIRFNIENLVLTLQYVFTRGKGGEPNYSVNFVYLGNKVTL